MGLFARKAIILAKKEATYGVDAAPTGAANAILVRNLNVTPQNSEFANRDVIRPYYGNSEQLPVNISVVCEMEVELAGAGAAGTAPKYADLLKACAFAETISAGVKVEYDPVSDSIDSATLWYSLGSDTSTRVVHKVTGARGNVSFVVNAKGIPVMRFRFQGKYSAVVDDATALTPDFSGFTTPLPVNQVNTPTFTLHGVSAPYSELSLDMANQLAFRSLPGGQEKVLLTGRRPAGQVVFEAMTVAIKDWWTVAKEATTGALALVHGTVAGNIVKLDCPKVQVTNPQYRTEDGIQMLACGLSLLPGAAGNDELKLTVQ